MICVGFPRSMLKSSKVTDIADATREHLREAQFAVGEEVFARSQELRLFDFVNSMNLGRHATDKYVLVGRRVENVLQGQAFGFLIE
jgi:hypothetical protein